MELYLFTCLLVVLIIRWLQMRDRLATIEARLDALSEAVYRMPVPAPVAAPAPAPPPPPRPASAPVPMPEPEIREPAPEPTAERPITRPAPVPWTDRPHPPAPTMEPQPAP